MSTRLDFSLRKVSDETIVAIPGGHEISATAYVARVDAERLSRFVAVATATETYSGWQPEDYQAAALRLHRKLKLRLTELAAQHARDTD